MSTPAFRARMLKESAMLETQPPPHCTAWRIQEQNNHWHAQIRGPADTPYEGGCFKLEIRVPDRYPFEPPRVQFLTPIYHPNIDREGRICLDTLNMPPKGSWSPGSNLCTVLASIQQLMAYPNANDGLVAEITQHFKDNRASFDRQAKEMTQRHAVARAAADSTSAASAAATSDATSAAAGDSAAAPAAFAPAAASVAANPAAAASVAGSNISSSVAPGADPTSSFSSDTSASNATSGSKRSADSTASPSADGAPPDSKKQRTEEPAIADDTGALTSTTLTSTAQTERP